MKKIRNKLLLVLIIVTLIPALLIGGYSLYSTSKVLRENVLASHVNKLSLIQERIENLLNSVDSDLFYLRDSSALQLYLSSTNSGESRTQRLLLSNLRSSLKKFSEKKNIYLQVRFIDNAGQEIVRIDRVNGQVKIVANNDLQNKSSRDYFINTIDLDKDDLFISALDLNRERGQVVKPLQPVIRYATPVFDKSDDLRGIFILNIDANYIINIVKEQNKTGEKLMFTNPQGFYYYHSEDNNKAWGGKNDLDTGENLFKENKELLAHLKDANKLDQVEVEDEILIYNPVSVNGKEHALGTVFSAQTKSSLFKPLKDYLMIFLSIALLALLLAFILAVLLANSITRPLIHLKKSVESLSQGDMETPIIETTRDEISDLAHAIELLRKSMRILMRRSS